MRHFELPIKPRRTTLRSIILCSFICADSSQHVCIEDCYISVGDDAISIKSGWDQYGTSFGMPSSHIKVRRIVAVSQTSAGISFGSEMSGGISHVEVSLPLSFLGSMY